MDTEDWRQEIKPPISHRYLAVRSGVGYFGYSGNIITKEYESAIFLASVVTDAELTPTDPLPEEAKEFLKAVQPERRRLYESVPEEE